MRKVSVLVTEDTGRIDSIVIDSQYCGPPGSGNGGYVCGRLAHYVDGPATVRLIVPPPVDKPLDIVQTGTEIQLRDRESLVARAWADTPDIEIPAAPGMNSARQRRNGFAGHKHHAFPGCFVCGTARNEGDGLLVFAGPDEHQDAASGVITNHVACNWTPHPAFCDDHELPHHFIWAALDCPSGWAFLSSGEEVALLGEFSAQIQAPLHCGQEYIVAGWEFERLGRKRLTGSAIYDPEGTPLAWARATWITIDHPG